MNAYRNAMRRAKLSPAARRRICAALIGVPRPRRPIRPLRWVALCACCALIVGAGWWALRPSTPHDPGAALPPATATPTAPPNQAVPPPPLAFTDCNGVPVACASIAYPTGYFFRTPDTDALDTLLAPLSGLVDAASLTAQAIFDGEGALWQMTLTSGDGALRLALAPGALPPSDTIYDGAQEVLYNGVPVTAYWLLGEREGTEEYRYHAEYLSGTVGVRLSYGAGDQIQARDFTTALVDATTGAGNALSLEGMLPGEIPEWRSEALTLTQAYEEPALGQYLPADPPSGFVFETAHRELGQKRNWLSAHWYSGYDHISVTVYASPDDERVHPLLSAHPSVQAGEVTLDFLEQLGRYVTDDAGDTPGWRYDGFVVQYENAIASYSVRGLTPQALLALIPPCRVLRDESPPTG